MDQDINTDFKKGDFVKIYGKSLNFRVRMVILAMGNSYPFFMKMEVRKMFCLLTGVKSWKYDSLELSSAVWAFNNKSEALQL